MSYGSTAGVQALVPSVTLGASSSPTTTQVTNWLGEGYAKINRALASGGYSTPVSVLAAVYPELTALENLYAAAYVLRARAIDSASGDGEERSELWLADFYSQLKELVSSDLSVVGVTPLPVTTPSRRRRYRTVQARRIDGYARGSTGETWEVQQGEYTGPTIPSD